MQKEPIAATNFRAHMYALLTDVLRTGKPLTVRLHDQMLEVRALKRKRKPSRAKANTVVNDLSKIKPPLRKAMTAPPEWYISPKLDEWDPDHDLD